MDIHSDVDIWNDKRNHRHNMGDQEKMTHLIADAVSREAVLDGLASIAKVKARSDAQKALMGRIMFFIEQLPSVTQKPNMTWVTGADGAKIAFKDVPVWKAIKICEILGESQESENEV